MKILPTIAIICNTLSKMVPNSCQRPYTNQFKITLKDSNITKIFDFRDLFMSKQFQMAYFAGNGSRSEVSSELDLLIRKNDLYQNVLAEIKVYCSTSDTYEYYEKLIESKLKKHDSFSLFIADCVSKEAQEFNLSFSLQVLYDVFQMTTGWCYNLNEFLTEEKALEFLKAFEFLEIPYEEEIDLYFDDDGKPFHLRIKAINLFCINFVYLLQTHCILDRFRALLNNEETQHEDENGQVITAWIKQTKPLESYIRLLKIDLVESYVSKIFLGSEAVFFAYDLLYENNGERIFLNAADQNTNEPFTELNFVAEINMLNHRANKRLEILMPFFVPVFKKRDSSPLTIPSDFEHNFSLYIQLMCILSDIAEVYIYNLLPLCSSSQADQIPEMNIDEFLISIVEITLKTLPELKSLFINGFVTFPDELVQIVSEAALEKFGVMGYYGEIDYIVVDKIFQNECPLKKSITHFVGHYGALSYIFEVFPDMQIRDTTSCNMLYEFPGDLPPEEKAYAEKINVNFKNGNLRGKVRSSKRIYIRNFTYMDPAILVKQDPRYLFKPLGDSGNHVETTTHFTYAKDALKNCKIENLTMCAITSTMHYVRNIHLMVTNLALYIEAFEFILNYFDIPSSYTIYNAISSAMQNGNHLILNLDANIVINSETGCDFNNNIEGICYVFHSVVVETSRDVKLTLKLRNKESEIFDVELLKASFSMFCEKFCGKIQEEKYENLTIEYMSYNINNAQMLEAIRL
ncbi:hypothetical protein ENBRE01_1971 [Enteropsectra breve]|nr:hypothetical protein ENBRE01_1971 [Enteropsectra breve]